MSRTYRNYNYTKKRKKREKRRLKNKDNKQPIFCETCGKQISYGKFCSEYCSEFEDLE